MMLRAPMPATTIRTSPGYVEVASALEQLSVLFEEIWDRVECRIPVTAEMVERAPVLAHELHALLGARKVRQGERNEAQRMRQRACTLLVKAYEECQAAVEFIRRRVGAVLRRRPKYRSHRSR